MKLNLKLGVPTEALLKHPTACFGLSKAMTRVSDSLAFGEFYLKETKAEFLLPRELDHLSASIHTSENSAKLLATLIDDADLKKEIHSYANAASRLNLTIRDKMKTSQKALQKKPAKGNVDTSEMMKVGELKKSAERLRKKLAEIEKNVEDLCTVRPTNAILTPPPALKGFRPRAGMSGSVPKKRPIYPRYFVASMGRSRR